MLEQQKSPAQDPKAAEPKNTTQLEGIRQKVFMDRYSLKDASGQPLEFHPEQTWERVARGIAAVETSEENRVKWEKLFYEALSDFQFVPGGRILAGAGTGHQVTYYNCFVIPSPEDSRQGILDNLKIMTEIMARGGGVGINLSTLRPRGSYIKTVNGTASGPCSWAQLYSVATGDVIQQGGCFGPDERIATNKGLIPASKLADRLDAGEVLQAQTHKGLRPFNYVFRNGIKDLYEVQTSRGFRARVTLDHKMGVLRKGEIVTIPLKELEEGDEILLLLGEGTSTTSEQVELTAIPDLHSFLGEILHAEGILPTYLTPELAQHIGNTYGSSSAKLRIPEAIFRSPTEVVEAFIDGYFEANGFNNPSREILADIQQLLLARGIASHISTEDQSQQTIYHLTIGNDQFQERLSQSVSYMNEQAAHRTLTPTHKHTPGSVAMLERQDTLSRVLSDTIVSITPLGPSEVFDFEVDEVHLLSGGGLYTSNSRRGALMIMLDDTHPDIEEFITVKRTSGKIEHANLSVCISDAFMQAVKDDADWNLTWNGEVKKTIRAKQLWDLICTSAWESAEPGMVFIDRYNKESNTWYYENIRCVNPCGEQGLPEWGVCNLGAINLSAFVRNGHMDYERLGEISRTAMRFLDNVVDANEYFIVENKEAQMGTRRTGLGTMGLADALLKMKIAYGSPESLPVIERIYATIRDSAYDASADISQEKGAFPHFELDKYMQGRFIKRLPRQVQEKIKKQGIRNAVLLTQAPTGTTSLLSGVSSGIEPVYDFAMIRRDRTGEHILYHPLLQEWREKHPNEETPGYFVASKDLSPEEHIRVQSMIQRYTDSSISKTVNAPNDHTVEQVQTLYRLAYETGCKGVTYYRDGSRDAVLTRVADENKTKQEAEEQKQGPMIEPVISIKQGIKARPTVVHGYTRQVKAPEGKINITINSDEQGPLEVFVTLGKAGSDIAALSEALGRLISLNLQILSPLSQTDRIKVISEQLRSIGGSRSVGFGAQQVRSLPDGVARALELHLDSLKPAEEENAEQESAAPTLLNGHSEKALDPLKLSDLPVTGNLCPECGCNTLVYEEGCRKCYTCGHSEC